MKAICLAAALSVAVPCSAAPELGTGLSVSTASAPALKLLLEDKHSQRRGSDGAGGGLSEGKPLEVMVWGSGGAVAGSLAGPPGALIGAGVGAALGLLYSIFIVPRNGPSREALSARRRKG